jgi:hypothetical protein
MGIALLLGSDYRRLLNGRSRFDMEIERAVMQAALEKRVEDRQGLAVEIANRLGPMIGDALSQTVQAIARAMR